MNESVQKWLEELTAAPSTAIQKLVLGYAGVSAWSRSSLRESFVEIFQTHAEALDASVAAWLQERLMKLPPEKTPTLVWASHLQDLFSALAGLPLPQVARLLRARLRDFRSWLRPLRTDESLDPEAAYLAALAWAETNQHLEGMWQGLALRRDREPAYYADLGLLGLRKTRNERGQLPSKAPFLLLATLIDLADTGLSQKDWLLTTRALLGGYHYSLETWAREFEPVLKAQKNAQNGPDWLKEILPHRMPLRGQSEGNELAVHVGNRVIVQQPTATERTVVSIHLVWHPQLAASAEAVPSKASMELSGWLHTMIVALAVKAYGESDVVPAVATGDGCLLFFSDPNNAMRFASDFRDEADRQSSRPRQPLEIAPKFWSDVAQVSKQSLSFRIGVASGQVVLQGTAGRSGQALGLTAVGGAIALSERLQSLAKPGQILIASATFESLRSEFRDRLSQVRPTREGEYGRLDIGSFAFLMAEKESAPVAPDSSRSRHGHETILVVEDEPPLRRRLRSILSRHGYRVLEASDGANALDLWRQHRSEIRLLLTDVVMPGGITGVDLARRLLEDDPGLKVVFASGYRSEIASWGFPLREGVNFISKPYQAWSLGATVRAALDRASAI